MNFFPQLSTGNSTQYPLKKIQSFRTVKVATEDGRTSRYSDSGSRVVQWELQFAGLTATEWAKLTNHFASAEVRRSFAAIARTSRFCP